MPPLMAHDSKVALGFRSVDFDINVHARPAAHAIIGRS